MIITNIKISKALPGLPEGKIVTFEHEGVSFKVQIIGDENQYLIDNADDLLERYYFYVGADFRNKVILANDILVGSPNIKSKRVDAYLEAKQEPLKKIKSVAKLALTLPKLIEHIEDLEERVKSLENV